MAGKPSIYMVKRMMGVVAFMIAATMISLSIALVNIMIVNGERYQSEASAQQLYDSTISAPRGDIYDVNGNVLATSTTAWTVYLSPNEINKISDDNEKQVVRTLIADKLSEILDVDRDKIFETSGKKTYYAIVKKKIDKTTADTVRQFVSDNNEKYLLSKYIGLDETTKRYYPNDNLASVILGFVGDDDQGLSGVESYYDTTLTGIAGRVVAAKSAKGTDMPNTYETVEEAIKGNSLTLTVDSYIQYVAEKELEQAVESNNCSERGACIVMNVNTGEILALAIKGDYNPNEPFTLSTSDNEKLNAVTDTTEKQTLLSTLQNKQWRNKAVSDAYEPGSVFKIITASAALEENITSLNSTYSCGYTIYVAGQPYHCHKSGGHGTQNLIQAMSNSCNPVFIMLGQLLGSDTFSKYFEAFGLTESTGIDLPGEGRSVYYTADKMGPTELASASFGQTFKVTPMQLISAASAAVNGGYLVQPHIVKQITDESGNVIETASTDYKRQVISTSTSEKIRTMLEYSVDGGGCKNGYVAGYRTGGKTGTSQKVAEMLEQNKQGLYVASYIGFAPIDNPEIAVLVLLDEPNGDSYYGSTLSAPVGSRVLAQALPYLGFEAHYTEAELASLAINVPDVSGLTVAEAKGKITTAGLIYKIVGTGDKVSSQLPTSSETLTSGGMVILYTGEGGEETNVTVPSLTNMTVAQVNTAAAEAGINIEFSGNTKSGTSVSKSQSVTAGSVVKYGTIVTVYFVDNEGAADFSGG